jgi:hypothetical protein
LTAEQKDALEKAQGVLTQYGTNFRKVMEVQRTIMPILRAGMGYGGFFGGMGFGRGGAGQLAEPGTYTVGLSVSGKTLTGKVEVRLDPIQAAADLSRPDRRP